MTSITLLSLRGEYLDSDKIYPPLANLYLHQALKQSMPDLQVRVTDNATLDELVNSDFVGVSVMTPQRQQAVELLEKLKGRTRVIVGGPHVKHYEQEVVGQGWDYVVPLDGIRSIVNIIKGTAPRVSKDFITIGDYQTQWVKPNRLDNADFLRTFNYKLNGVDSTTMLTAQGCPMSCAFCEEAGTATRWTPLNLIKQELDDIVSLGYKGIYIFDDLYALAMPKIKPICDEIKKRGLIYRCNGQANFFTKWGEDFAKLLADSGCVEIAFGHESGSQRILDNVNKKTKIEQNYRSVEYAKKYGIKVKSFLMLGLPGEDLETIADTERFIATAGMDDFQLCVYMPFKGTRIRDALDKGEDVDMQMMVSEVSGAYGIKGGETAYEIRTRALSAEDLKYHRDRLVDKYKPKSHENRWKDEKFFGEALKPGNLN